MGIVLFHRCRFARGKNGMEIVGSVIAVAVMFGRG